MAILLNLVKNHLIAFALSHMMGQQSGELRFYMNTVFRHHAHAVERERGGRERERTRYRQRGRIYT